MGSSPTRPHARLNPMSHFCKSNKHSYLKFPIHEYMFPSPHNGALQLHCPPLTDTCSSPCLTPLFTVEYQ
ncbi:hypothetical protein ACRRTK_016854 [Alexandromys fortis]